MIHKKYSSNKMGFANWIYSNYKFNPEMKILELGCGTGDMWKENLNVLNGAKILLTDFSEAMVNTAKNNLKEQKDIEYNIVNIEEIPYLNNEFDRVIANMMLYHVPDLELALSEVRRVLKPEGTFYAATYGEKNIMPFVHNLLREYMQAPAFKRHFMLENGWEPLRRHFNDVRLNKYSDKLLITDMNDLADYVQSLTGTSQISGVSRETMIKVFTDNCVDGVLIIPKEYGMFIGRA